MLMMLIAMLALPVSFATATPQPLVFSHLSLASAERSALLTSPDVLAAQARLLQSRYALATARTGGMPSFVTSYMETPQGNPPGPNVISRMGTAGIQVALGDLFAASPLIREAAFTLQAMQADEYVAETAERTKVVNLYYTALEARALAQARRNALELATTQRAAAAVRVSTGDAPKLDVMRAEVSVAKATADLETANAEDTNTSEALCVETACADGMLAETAPASLAPLDATLDDPQADVALARRLRPEIISADRALEAAQAGARAARAVGFPPITVGAGYSVGTDSGVPVNGPNVSVQLTLPLSAAAHDRFAVAAAKATEVRAKALGIERAIALEVAAAARSLGAARRASVATSRARASAEDELRAVELGYGHGASSSLEVSAARATYDQARVDELSSFYTMEKARATLEIEIGR